MQTVCTIGFDLIKEESEESDMDTKRDADIATYGCGPLQPVTRNTDAGGPGQNNMLFVLFILDLFISKRKQTMKKKKVSRIVVATHRGL